VSWTFRYLNDIQAALDHSASADEYATHLAWALPGREQEAVAMLREREKANPPGRLRHGFLVLGRTYLEGDRAKSLEAIDQCLQVQFHDPEARFGLGAFLAKLNEPKLALETISQALEEGYVCRHMLLHHPWLDSLRSHPGFPELVNRAAERSARARAVFLDNSGERLLGTEAQIASA
jgi:hypothetical protein